MDITKSNTNYYRFKDAILKQSRYCLSDESRSFLEMLKSTWDARSQEFEKKVVVCRAQRGCDWSPMYDNHGDYVDDRPVPFGEERMRPRGEFVTAGRSNVAGIPVFYASSDRDTAISEVHPGRGDVVSVGIFGVKQKLRLIDCNKDTKYNLLQHALKDTHTIDDLINCAWHDVSHAFSRPISADVRSIDYIPTQVIAEFFKVNGFDGFHHKSALGSGYNLVLFDISIPKYIGSEVHSVVDIHYTTELTN